jgi:hypothetical protein
MEKALEPVVLLVRKTLCTSENLILNGQEAGKEKN